MKLSKWIDGKKFKPADVGVYETKDRSKYYKCFAKRYWDGREWSMGWFHNSAMASARIGTARDQSPTFRGLAENPNK